MPKLGFLKIAALFSINIVITSTTNHPRPTPRRRSLEVNKYIDIYSDFDVERRATCTISVLQKVVPHLQTNQSLTELDLVLSRALRQTSDVDFSPQCIFQFVVGCSTYLHIYISTYLYPGGRGGVLANAGDPARVRALLPQLHPVPVQDGGLPVGLQPEHPPHPRPGGTNIKFYQYKTKIFSV